MMVIIYLVEDSFAKNILIIWQQNGYIGRLLKLILLFFVFNNKILFYILNLVNFGKLFHSTKIIISRKPSITDIEWIENRHLKLQ